MKEHLQCSLGEEITKSSALSAAAIPGLATKIEWYILVFDHMSAQESVEE